MKIPLYIPPRLWLIEAPGTWTHLGIVESHLPEEACDKVAKRLGLRVGRFRSLLSDSGRHLDHGAAGEILCATNVTGILSISDNDRLNASELRTLLEENDMADEGEEFIAPIE